MKVVLYMETTVNGLVAKQDDGTDWISEEAWSSYEQIMSEVDAIIVGKRTYDLMPVEEFQKNVEYIVITSNKEEHRKVANVRFSNESPNTIIENLTSKGYQKVAIAGGGKTNASFMKEGLVDEMYLDIEPLVLGSGIPLFAPSDFEYKLQLLETKMLNKNTIQLHYKITK